MPEGGVGDLPLIRGASLDHVAVAVRDPADAARLYRDVLGGSFLYGADETGQAFRFIQYRLPAGGKIELVTPLGPGFVQRFLDIRGEGVHHVTLRVEDLRAQLVRLEESGIEPVLVSLGDPHWKEAFLHPRDAHGVLVQLAETPHTDEATAEHMSGRFPEALLLADPG
jgi:methylmalonyl-CoA/ethylmalonyl-CoA epimerase